MDYRYYYETLDGASRDAASGARRRTRVALAAGFAAATTAAAPGLVGMDPWGIDLRNAILVCAAAAMAWVLFRAHAPAGRALAAGPVLAGGPARVPYRLRVVTPRARST